jgi:hypothetical protein
MPADSGDLMGSLSAQELYSQVGAGRMHIMAGIDSS